MGLSPEKWTLLHDGAFIPAHPLALTEQKKLDEASQRRLTRYYLEAGVDGIAVGVHTTQFEIRDPKFSLFEDVLRIASEEVEMAKINRPFLKIAGVCGPTEQAVKEAKIARNLGYDLVLLSNGGLNHYTEADLLKRTELIAEIIPVFGFYLQPAVGGRVFSYHFWTEFANIKNVLAIKMAPFNRYQTLDVVRAVCESKRRDEIALYTGNDDNIVIDLLTTYAFNINNQEVKKTIVGGLLGHWSVWTRSAVQLFNAIKEAKRKEIIDLKWLTIAQKVTDANAAFFDTAHQFKGSISGINEVLRRQGLLQGNWCLADHEVLSDGQSEEISRVTAAYPELNDDSFIKSFLSQINGQ
ncbi:dihydrodipicolinate synthase family protein [Cytobacillus solani]|uniref:Dihydrodipicolinate synthetase n=1 Tax=Cytobacillus solani TaxID=1637975 RepID=A0A0Q3VJF2_9BACI|nr:dihydrodipicolinate synthase family protein [Cytobacillus solani]KQL21399.1 dihydrodipicolinate synthetase [Cytobacillus solani]USK57671.1 dihydrodipicolinate synthase family protein [Cytobacillus solani]